MAGFFQLSTDQDEKQAGIETDKLTDPNRNKTFLRDIDTSVGKGVESTVVQPMAALMAYAGRKLNNPVLREAGEGHIRSSQQRVSELSDVQTPEWERASRATLFKSKDPNTPSISEDPLRSIAAKTTEMVPAMIVAAIPGTLLARLGVGAAGVAAATGTTGAAMGAGDMANTVSQEIDKIPHEQLMQESGVYRHAIENGESPEKARETIKEIAQDEQIPLATLVNFATNAFGPEAMLAKALGGHGVAKGFLKGAAEGAGAGFATEAIEGGTTAYGQEKTAENLGGQPFNWMDVAKQAIEEGAFGSIFGGTFGGVANIKATQGRKKAGGLQAQPPAVVAKAAPTGPDPTQAAALAGVAKSPVPPPSPPVTGASLPVNTPQGPQVVTPGAPAAPPGAKVQKTKRNYKKAAPPEGAATVQATAPAGPDATQAAAMATAQPPAATPAPTPPQTPLVRKRAQAELAAVPQPPVTQAPPVEAAPPSAPAIQEPASVPAPAEPQVAPPQAPPIPEAEVAQPSTPQPPIVLGGTQPKTGRVLPDLQAQARIQAEREAAMAKPDEVAQRGTRYAQTEASVDNPIQHAAWRRKMLLEAERPDASEIALAVSKVKSKQGKPLTEAQKSQLRDLHEQWLAGQAETPKAEENKPPRGQRGKYGIPGSTEEESVKTPEAFITAAIRHVQDLSDPKDRIEAFAEIVRNAPNREELRDAIRNSDVAKAAAIVKEKIDNKTVKPEDIEYYKAVEKDAVAQTQEELDRETQDIEKGMMGGRGLVDNRSEAETDLTGAVGGIDDEIQKVSDKNDSYETTTKGGKAFIAQEGSESRPPSEVRKPALSDEERARYVALASKSAPAAAAKPAAAVPEGRAGNVQRASEPAAPSTRAESVGEGRQPSAPAATAKEAPVAKSVGVAAPVKEPVTPKGKKKVQNIAQARNEAIDSLGRIIMDMRSKAREEAKSAGADSPVLAGLLKDIKDLQGKLEQNFGKAAHDRVMKTVEAALSLPGTSQNVGALPEWMNERQRTVFKRIQDVFLREQSDADARRLARDSVPFDMMGKSIPGPKLDIVEHGTVGGFLGRADFDKVAADWADTFYKGTEDVAKAMYRMIVPRLRERIGDVPVYIVSDKTWDTLLPYHIRADGIQVPNRHAIYIRESRAKGNPSMYAHVLLHEAVHAAFVNAQWRSKTIQDAVNRIMREVQAKITPEEIKNLGIGYAFTNDREFVAEAFSNPHVQLILASTRMSAELAHELGMSRFQSTSVWAGFVNLVRKTLNLPPKFVSALDGVVRVITDAAVIYPSDSRHGTHFEADMDDPFVRDALQSMVDEQMPGTSANVPQQNMQQEIIPRLPKASLRNFVLNFTTLHQMAQIAERYFPKNLALKVSDIVEKKRLYRTELISEASDRVVTTMHQLQNKYAGKVWDAFQNLADRATSANVHPDVPLSDPRNKHVTKSFKWRFARAEHAELSKEWAALPSDLKQVWTDARTYLVDRQNQIAYLNLKNIVEASLGKADEQLTQRIFRGTATEADRALFKTNKALAAVNRARELKQIKGVYFPKMRRGDYVVTGEYQLPQWVKHQSKTDGDHYTFDNIDDAIKFMHDMRARGITVTGATTYSVETATGARKYSIDPTTGKPFKLDAAGNPVEYRFARGDTGTHVVYDFTVQKKLVEFFESERAAHLGHARLKEDTNYVINGVEKRLDQAVRTSHATSRQIKGAIKSMEQTAAWKNMSKAQRQALEQAFMELSLSFVSSTAPQNRARPRRNVLGASKDFTRNVAEYTAAAAGQISNLEFGPELEKAFDALEQHRDQFRQQTSDITLPRSQLLDAMRKNAYADDGTAPTKRNKAINALLAVSFLDKLVSPAYHMINSLQPWMVSAPVLGGRHGFARATYELGRAYKSMGAADTLYSGIKDTKRAITDLLQGTTDYMADLRKKLAKQADGADLIDMMDYLHDRGLIDKDAGLEVSELIQSTSKPAHYLHRVDHVVRQLGTSVEVINRAVTAIAAYRMERARGATHEEARVYAQESVANTQGNYSMSNAPKVFKHPLGRTVLQFKKFAQLQYFLMSKMAYNAFKGATTEEKLQGAKGLAALLAAHVAMAGFTGLPTEPIKIPWLILSMFLPMPSWEEVEQNATEYAQSYLGGDIGDAVAHGLPRLAGIDLNSRVGLNSLVLFGEPRKQEEESIKAWVFDTVLGAPFGLGVERIKGVRALLNGEFGQAAEQLMPLKLLSDSVKAYRRATEGKVNNRGQQTEEPSGIGDSIIRGLGFTPAGEARKREATSAYFTQVGNRKKARQDLLDEFTSAQGSARTGIRRKILRYNAGVPKDARITMKQLDDLLKRHKRDQRKGYVRQGVYGGKQNQDLLDKYIGE